MASVSVRLKPSDTWIGSASCTRLRWISVALAFVSFVSRGAAPTTRSRPPYFASYSAESAPAEAPAEGSQPES